MMNSNSIINLRYLERQTVSGGSGWSEQATNAAILVGSSVLSIGFMAGGVWAYGRYQELNREIVRANRFIELGSQPNKRAERNISFLWGGGAGILGVMSFWVTGRASGIVNKIILDYLNR